jgi:hypothetical protein
MRNNKSIRYERGPCRLHKDCVTSTGKRPMGDTTITYLESNATNPPDILYVGSKRYEITPGLKVTIKNGEYHSIKSQDPKSLRKFTAKDEDGNDVMMSFTLLPLLIVGSFGLGWLAAKEKYTV